MNVDKVFPFRVVSGFRPIKRLHVGHYAAVLKTLVRLQYAKKWSAFVFIADHHSRCSWDEKVDFANSKRDSIEIARQLLACGLDPSYCALYIQSDIPELLEVMW